MALAFPIPASYAAVQSPDAAAARLAGDILGALARKRTFDSASWSRLLELLRRDLAQDPLRQLCWNFSEAWPDYRPMHALNACRLALFLAMAQGRSEPQAEALALAALLYDVGMWHPRLTGVQHAGPLTEQERDALSRHSALGQEMLAGVAGLNPLAARLAREHHERPDGSGYPDSTPRNSHHEASSFIQLVDSFLGQVEPRPFRKARSPADAMGRLLLQSQRGHYDAAALRSLLLGVGLYPLGSVVRLSGGETALVRGVNPDDLKRPPLLLLTDAAGVPRERPLSIALADYPAQSVIDVQ